MSKENRKQDDFHRFSLVPSFVSLFELYVFGSLVLVVFLGLKSILLQQRLSVTAHPYKINLS